MPGEWENQEAVFLTYTEDPNDAETSAQVRKTCDELVGILSEKIPVYLLINDEWNTDTLRSNFIKHGFNPENIRFVKVKNLFSMGVARDYGPIIVRDSLGLRKLVQFNWDYVGADMINPDTSWTHWKDRLRDGYFRQMSELLGMGIIKSELTIEGGEIELNGEGTAILVESFTKPRHPAVSADAFDGLLKNALGVSHIIWLKEGAAEDPSSLQNYAITDRIYGFGVGGHVDEFARFANAKTVLLAFPDSLEGLTDPVKKINYERMKVNFDRLSAAKDQDGNALTLIKMPIPDIYPDTFVVDTTIQQRMQVKLILRENPALTHGDSILFMPACSYLNFIVLNDLVVIPAYWREGLPESTKRKDEEVKQIFQNLYPNREIVQLNPIGLNYGGGGFHCWTQQIPAK